MKILIVGPGGSGKDHLKTRLVGNGARPSVSYTTRPMRAGETPGQTYHFVSEQTFMELVNNGSFYEWERFGNGHLYGTPRSAFDSSADGTDAGVFIMTPRGIRSLSPEHRAGSMVIYLDIPEGERLARLMARADADHPERRIETDRRDFADFADWDLRVTNEDF